MPAGSTYEPLATVTASGVTTFLVMSSIPSTYTDLVLVGIFPKTGAGSSRLTVNNDSSSGLYSQTVLYANGTSVGSGYETNQSRIYLMDYLSASTSNANMSITHFMNYSNTTTFKSFVERSGVADKGISMSVGLWRNTSAINRIDISDGSNFSAGTRFTLYGIKAA